MIEELDQATEVIKEQVQEQEPGLDLSDMKLEPAPKKKSTGFFAAIGNFFGGSKKKEKAKKRATSSDEEMNEQVYMQRNLSACSMDNEELDRFNSDEEPA
jgi:hypothetical protein